MEPARLPLLVLAALACLATSAPRLERSYPAWELAGPASRETPCGALSAWVSKSGKEGLGVTLELESRPERPCALDLVGARVEIAAARSWASSEPWPARRLEVPPGEVGRLYLPFAFDNERLWNEGKRTGALHLGYDLDGAAQPEWSIPMEHVLRGFHRARRSAP